PDGKWIYFLSDREIRSVVAAPWGPRQPEPFFDQITRIYQVALQKDLRSPFQPRDELYDPDKEEKDKKEEKADEKPEKDGEKGEKKNESKPPEVKIDLPGLADRLYQLPVAAGNFRQLSITAKHLLWIRQEHSFEAKPALQQLEITNDSPKPKSIIEEV